ncbi:MAG TPA: NADH-quinone oxidoreductase subunit J [bacterium]
MLPVEPISHIAFGLLAVLILAGAGWVVALPNLFRAALSLGIVLVGVAGVFILLEAEFLAFIQILVYVGAILTIIVFAVMLTANVSAPAEPIPSSKRGAAALASLAMFAVLAGLIRGIAWPSGEPQAPTTAAIGQQLVTTLVLPFELISVLFVAVMIGAITLATATRDEPRGAPKAPRG